MAEAVTAVSEKPEVVKGDTKELVVVSGMSFDLMPAGESIFTNVLTADMDPEQRKKVIRETLKKSSMIDDHLNLVQGELLYEVSKNGYWQEWKTVDDDSGEERAYSSLEEYALLECGMKRRKAYYQIEIYETFVIKLELPKAILQDLEWSKAKEVAKLLTPENWKEHLDKIKGMTFKQTQAYVSKLKDDKKLAKAADGKSGVRETKEPEVTEKIVFKLHPDQLENVNMALATAASMSGSDKPGAQLDFICSDFMASAAGSGLAGALAKLDVVQKNIERAFGVRLEVAGVDAERYEKLKKADAEEKAAKEAEKKKEPEVVAAS